MRRAITRGLLVGALAASFFGAAARGQIAETHAPRIKATPVADHTNPGPKGAAVTPVVGTHQETAHLTMTATNVQMSPCASTPRTDTRLGIMKNSAAYTHCDFP
jgi:hypothetical protein